RPERSPRCSTAANQRRRVLRIWRAAPAFIRFYCARCGAKGYANDRNKGSSVIDLDRQRRLREGAGQRAAQHRPRPPDEARWLWSQSIPLTGTIAEPYLRDRRRLTLNSWPATLRFLPPTNPKHHPAMIAAFVIPTEPEPEVLAIDAAAVRAIHLTLL